MPDQPQEQQPHEEQQPHRERQDNPGWRGAGWAMTTSVFGQGSEGDAPRHLGRMAGVIERVRSATFMLDGDGAIREYRLNAEELFGWDRTDMLGKPFRTMFRPEDAEAADAMVEAIRSGDDARGELEAVTPNGTSVPVDVHLMGLRDDEHHVMVFGYANSAEDLVRVTRDRAVLDSLFEQFPVGVVVFDEEGRYIRLNRALERINGVPVSEHIGKRIREVLPALDPRLEEIPDQVLETGVPVVDEQYGGFTPASEEERVWSVSYNRLHGPDGEVIGLSGLILDVTDRHRAAAAAAGARRRLALVNKAGSRMGTALDVERTARELADVAVPDFADAVVIEIREEVFDERIGPVGPVWLAPVRRRRVLVHEGGEPVSDPVRAEGFSAWSTDPDISDRMLGGAAWHSAAGISAVAKEPIRAADGTLLWQPTGGDSILVPLWAREALLGVVHFHRHPDSSPFEPEDIDVAEEITTRAAVSMDNGRLYYRERTTALMLQRALLPQRIPSLPGVQVAYRYLPGSVGAEVGGDWFDVIQLSGARVALVVGRRDGSRRAGGRDHGAVPDGRPDPRRAGPVSGPGPASAGRARGVLVGEPPGDVHLRGLRPGDRQARGVACGPPASASAGARRHGRGTGRTALPAARCGRQARTGAGCSKRRSSTFPTAPGWPSTRTAWSRTRDATSTKGSG